MLTLRSAYGRSAYTRFSGKFEFAVTCGSLPFRLSHHGPASPVLGNREMQAATPAAVARSQLLERSTGDETPAVTMLTTTPNDAIVHAELVQASPSSRTVDA